MYYIQPYHANRIPLTISVSKIIQLDEIDYKSLKSDWDRTPQSNPVDILSGFLHIEEIALHCVFLNHWDVAFEHETTLHKIVLKYSTNPLCFEWQKLYQFQLEFLRDRIISIPNVKMKPVNWLKEGF